MSCLYNSMKRLGLPDVDAVKARYIAALNAGIQTAFDKPITEIVKTDSSLDQNAMGSANFLQMYADEHDGIAFMVNSKNMRAPWLITGKSMPKIVLRIEHSGSADGGHFEPGKSVQGDVIKACLEWERRMKQMRSVD